MLRVINKKLIDKYNGDNLLVELYKKEISPFIEYCKDNKYKVIAIIYSNTINRDNLYELEYEVGINQHPLGESMRDEYGHTKPEVVHAEEQVIMQIDKRRFTDFTLVVNYAPCPHCAGMIILNRRITKVIYDKLIDKHAEGIEILKRAGIEVVQKDFHLEELYDEFK